MKGVVFSFGKFKRAGNRSKSLSLPDFKYIFRRYGITLLFVFLLVFGLTLGALYARSAQSETLNSLDLLFTTNLDARLSQSALGTFCACFASDFIFLISIYFFGSAPWGLPFELFTVLFKGFGVGVTAAFLFISHGLSGVGFYLLILLPGTFMFCAVLVRFSAYAFDFSRRMFGVVFSKNTPSVPVREGFMRFSSAFLTALIFTFAASVIDTLLWTFFAGAFKF